MDAHFYNIWNCSKHIKTKFSKQKAQWERNDLLVPEQECCYSLLFLNVCHYSSPYGSGHACLSSTLKLLSCSKRWFQLMPPRTFLYCTIHSAGLCSVLTVNHRECSISVNYFIHLVAQCNVLCGVCSTTSWCCITGTDTVADKIKFLMDLNLMCQTLAKHAQHTKLDIF